MHFNESKRSRTGRTPVTARTVHVEERIAVAAPPEKVFAALTDWERQSDWIAFTKVVVDAGEPGVGQRFTATTGIGPAGFADQMEVTRWEPPHRADVVHLGKVVRGTGSFQVAPAPGGSWLTWIEDLELPLGTAGEAGFKAIGPAARLFIRRSMRALARAVEAQTPVGRRHTAG
jgi:carbon monoxide dehydrogenase subunit G